MALARWGVVHVSRGVAHDGRDVVGASRAHVDVHPGPVDVWDVVDFVLPGERRVLGEALHQRGRVDALARLLSGESR